MGVLHETGHALYERGLPAAYARQPVGEAAGMAAHESQSLIVEMQACRSDAFLACARARAARSLRRRSRAPIAPANLARLWRHVGARLHPRRRRRDDLSGACHPALPAGAGADRRRPRSRRSAGRLERRASARCSASCRQTMRAAACRTSIGTTARSAISPATRWARWRRRS